MKRKQSTLSLGSLQINMEEATKELLRTNAALLRAKEANDKAEAEYGRCKQALTSGVEQLRAATRVI